MMFGDRLKEERLKKQLTQEELGNLVNKSKNNISQYETGKREPDLNTIQSFANIFNCSADYLLGISNERNQDKKDTYTVDEIIEILPDEYKNLFKEQNIKYVNFADALMKNKIDVDKLIKLIEITENVKIELENEKNEKNDK